MKCLSLLVNESSKRELVELLRSLPEVSGYTVFRGEGHESKDQQPFATARDEVLGFVPRIRIDLFLASEHLEGVVEQLKRCNGCGTAGRGVYWVSSVDSMGEL